MTREPIPLFVDCDTGIDDALALAYLLAEPAVRVVGIGTVSGNVSADQAAHNTLALLELAGRTDIPVAIGAANPLRGEFKGGAPHVHGVDGVGGIGLDPSTSAVVTRSAIDLLRDLAQQWDGRLRVLALGPLTNLAHFSTTHAASLPLIADMVVMGGAFDHPGNITAVAEANIHNDPEAAAVVFDGEWPLTVVPLDITMKHVLSEEDADAIAAIQGELPLRLAQMLGTYFDFYERVFGIRQCALHDPLAAIVAAGTVGVTTNLRPSEISVVIDGPDRGLTLAHDSPDPRQERRIVQDVAEPASQTLLRQLRAHSWPTQSRA
jgi:purine nucleosidase